MGAAPGKFKHTGMGREALPLGEAGQRAPQIVGDGLVDATAALTDHEHDEVVATVLERAGDECIAALNSMHKAVVQQELESPIDADGRRTGQSGGPDPVRKLVGTDRPVRGIKGRQNLAADRCEP